MLMRADTYDRTGGHETVRTHVAEDLRLAMRALGRITGAVRIDELLDVIFRDFCIGK